MRGYMLIILAAVMWGIIGPVARLAYSEGLQPMEVALWRAVLAWFCFGTHALVRRQLRMELRDVPMVLLFAIFCVSLFYGFYQLAIKNGGAALAAVLLYTAPAWVTVMSRFFLKERLTVVKLCALAMTLLGVVGVSVGAGDLQSALLDRLNYTAIIFGLLSGFCYALYYIFGKHFSGRYSSPNLFIYALPVGALGILPWVTFGPKSAAAWTALVILAVVSTYLAYYFYYAGLQYLEATRAAIVATLEPVIAAVVAFFWWHEFFSPVGYMGGALIVGAVVLIVWDGKRSDARKHPSMEKD